MTFGIIILFIGTALVSGIHTDSNVKSIDGNHPPITIDGNDDFTSENGVTGGSGTEEDPYIIDDWIIVGDGSLFGGIFINNTNAYFIIRNCTINEFHHSVKHFYGIKLNNVENGNIKDSTLYKNHVGIWIRYSSNIFIDNCSCYDYPVLYGNGIDCYYSKFVKINSYECYNMYDGVDLSHCSDTTIMDSEIYNNAYHGIHFYGSSKTDNNRINIINCSVYNNQNDGIRVEERVRHPSYSVISGCDIYNNGDTYQGGGIKLYCISDNVIENCNIYGNDNFGIYIDNSNNIIRNCSVYNHSSESLVQTGIMLGGSIQFREFSINNKIINCDIYNNEIGIATISTFAIGIHKNNINNNSWYGITPWILSYGKVYENNIVNNGFFMPENNTYSVVTVKSFLDMRNNWWGAYDGPMVFILGYKNIHPLRLKGSGEKILCNRIPVLYRPWAKEPIPDAGVQ